MTIHAPDHHHADGIVGITMHNNGRPAGGAGGAHVVGMQTDTVGSRDEGVAQSLAMAQTVAPVFHIRICPIHVLP